MQDNYKISSLKEMLQKSGEVFGDRQAYEIDGEIITHKEFRKRVDYLGTALINAGLKGKRIGVIGENSINWEYSYLAIVCGTGVVVPLDRALPANELESLIKRSEINAIFFDSKYEEIIKNISKKADNKLETLITMGETEDTNIMKQKDLLKKGKELVEKNVGNVGGQQNLNN